MYTGLYKYMQHLIVTPEPLPETGVLASHSSDFSLLKWTDGQPEKQTLLWRSHHDLIMMVLNDFTVCLLHKHLGEACVLLLEETLAGVGELGRGQGHLLSSPWTVIQP